MRVRGTGTVTVRFYFYFVLLIDFTTVAEFNVISKMRAICNLPTGFMYRAQISDCFDKSSVKRKGLGLNDISLKIAR